MKAKIEITMDNAAFEDGPELRLILEQLIERHVQDCTRDMLKGFQVPLRDSNGNKVGEFKVTSR